MRTVILGERPPELEAWIERRRRLGLDGRDEVWEGDYYMAPAAHGWHGLMESQVAIALHPHVRRAGLVQSGPFNLGDSSNFRVPDAGVLDRAVNAVWIPTALVVVEILSPDDESLAKLPFYAGRGVREVVLVDPRVATLRWLAHSGEGEWIDVDRGTVLDVAADQLAAEMTWPS